jgi:uncharacterized protein (TIGR02145 family)
MKNKIYLVVGVLLLCSCKKESSINATTNSNTNNSNTATCGGNPNINFTSIGTPIGKFGDCVKDIDGNTYKTVNIGSQTWMAENLKVSKYNDGTEIPNITNGTEWSNLTTSAWCNYNNSDSIGKIYGKLYNWYTINTNGNKNVCPTGWHIPKDSEWVNLTQLLGGFLIASGKMKEIGTTNWLFPNSESTNSSLFSGIPSGYRSNYNGEFYGINSVTLWLSSTNYPISTLDNIWGHGLNYANGVEARGPYPKKNGFSIRCIKD